MPNLFENHVNRRNHVANAYHEDIFAKVIPDKVSESIRDEVKVQFEGVTASRQRNIELGLFHTCLFSDYVEDQHETFLILHNVRIS